MKTVKAVTYIIFTVILGIAMCLPVGAVGDMPDNSEYIYSNDGVAVYAPSAYSLLDTVRFYDIGLSDVGFISDLCVAQDNSVYVLDSGNGRIIHLSAEYELISIISAYTKDGNSVEFNNPQGISVSKDGSLCVCDTNNGCVVVMDGQGNTISVIDGPDSDNTLVDYSYFPQKAAFDNSGRLLVVAKDQTQGLMVFDKNGQFTGYLGATPVEASLGELFWRRFQTKEQRKRTVKFVPTEFNNIDIDDEGFIFVTSLAETKVERLNPGGTNVLKTNGYYKPYGDIDTGISSLGHTKDSTVVDIATGKNGVYSILSQNTGRVFTYDSYGNLLYIFGGFGSARDLFESPIALDYQGNDIVIAEQDKGCLKIFRAEKYATDILSALQCHQNGLYDEAQEHWNDVLSSNNNYELAYLYLGKVANMSGNYKAAMEYFVRAGDKENYSKAKAAQNAVNGEKMIRPVCFAGGALLIYLISVYVRKKFGIKVYHPIRWIKNRVLNFKTARELSFSLKTMIHPFNGFWDIKAEERVGVISAILILFFTVIVNIAYIAGMPYLFSNTDPNTNLLFNGFVSVAFLPLIWCISNWSFTTLTDGKGNFKNIFIYTMVALLPRSISQIVVLVIAQFVNLSGATFIYTVLTIGILWTAFLLFCGTLVTHEYTAVKTIFSIILIIVGILIILFMLLVVFSLMQKIFIFAEELITELSIRI